MIELSDTYAGGRWLIVNPIVEAHVSWLKYHLPKERKKRKSKALDSLAMLLNNNNKNIANVIPQTGAGNSEVYTLLVSYSYLIKIKMLFLIDPQLK